MSEIGFNITQTPALSDEDREALRRHFLIYPRAERDDRRDLHADLDMIYDRVDAMVEKGELLAIAGALEECDHIVVFCTDASSLVLREFQQAMLAEGKVVRLISETHSDINSIPALLPTDLLIVVTTSNGFARRQRERIAASKAFKVVVTASEDPELHSMFYEVLSLGTDCAEGSPLHGIYSTFGVTYLFTKLFAQYARAFDPELK